MISEAEQVDDLGALEKKKMPKHQERVLKKSNRDHLGFMLTLKLTSIIMNAVYL